MGGRVVVQGGKNDFVIPFATSPHCVVETEELTMQIRTFCFVTALGATTVLKEYFEHGTSDFYTLLTKLRSSGADAFQRKAFLAALARSASVR